MLNSFKNNGYVICKNLLNVGDIERIRLDAKLIFEIQMRAKGYDFHDDITFEQALYQFFRKHPDCFFNCGKHIQHLISLHQVSLDPKIMIKLHELGLAFPNICTRPVLYFNTKHLATKEIYYKMPAHQDFFSMEGSHDSLVVWVPLVNVNKALGALEVVPKSHTQGLLTDANEEGFGIVNKYSDADFQSVELQIGDVLFFSSFLVHRSGNNITDNIRWSCHFRYNNMQDPDFIKRNYPHPYIYKPKSKNV